MQDIRAIDRDALIESIYDAKQEYIDRAIEAATAWEKETAVGYLLCAGAIDAIAETIRSDTKHSPDSELLPDTELDQRLLNAPFDNLVGLRRRMQNSLKVHRLPTELLPLEL